MPGLKQLAQLIKSFYVAGLRLLPVVAHRVGDGQQLVKRRHQHQLGRIQFRRQRGQILAQVYRWFLSQGHTADGG